VKILYLVLTLEAETLATLLEGIAADCVELNFRISVKSAVQFGTILSDYFTSKGYDVKKLQGSICFDPFLRMLQIGKEMTKEIGTKIYIFDNVSFVIIPLPNSFTKTKAHSQQRCEEFSTRRMQNLNLR
jgi:hypothetical protein